MELIFNYYSRASAVRSTSLKCLCCLWFVHDIVTNQTHHSSVFVYLLHIFVGEYVTILSKFQGRLIVQALPM